MMGKCSYHNKGSFIKLIFVYNDCHYVFSCNLYPFLWSRPEDEENVRGLFTAAEFEYIPDCTHILHVKKSVEFCESVSKFINRKCSRSRSENISNKLSCLYKLTEKKWILLVQYQIFYQFYSELKFVYTFFGEILILYIWKFKNALINQDIIYNTCSFQRNFNFKIWKFINALINQRDRLYICSFMGGLASCIV